MGGQRHAPAALSPGRPGTHCIGGWVGPTAVLDGCGKSPPPPTGIRSPDRPARGKSLYRRSYHGPYVSHRARFLILTAVLAKFDVFLDVKLCRWANIPQCFEGRGAPSSSGSSRVRWLQYDRSKHGNCSTKDKTSHPTRSDSFSLSVQHNTLRLAPVHFPTKLWINTFTLRSFLKLTPRPHTYPLCLDIAHIVQCVDINIFVQQMHNIFINNYLFLTALLHVSMFLSYAASTLLIY